MFSQLGNWNIGFVFRFTWNKVAVNVWWSKVKIFNFIWVNVNAPPQIPFRYQSNEVSCDVHNFNIEDCRVVSVHCATTGNWHVPTNSLRFHKIPQILWGFNVPTNSSEVSRDPTKFSEVFTSFHKFSEVSWLFLPKNSIRMIYHTTYVQFQDGQITLILGLTNLLYK